MSSQLSTTTTAATGQLQVMLSLLMHLAVIPREQQQVQGPLSLLSTMTTGSRQQL
jgi:hypothetical protein